MGNLKKTKIVLLMFLFLPFMHCSQFEQFGASYGVEIFPRKEMINCVVYLDDGFLMGPMYVGKGYGKTYSMIERKRPKLIKVSWEDTDGGKHHLNVVMKGKYPDAWKIDGDTIVVIVNADNTYDLQFVVFEGEGFHVKIRRLPPKGKPTE